MNDFPYTISEFARRAGLTVRTLRFYEEIGLLVPSQQNQAGHRLYDMTELTRLQHIQALKFLGYSLQDIQQLLQEQNPSSEQFYDSLTLQHQLLREKRDELNRALEAIEHVQALLDQGHPINWTMLSPLLHSMQHEEDHKEWLKEYFSEELVEKMYNPSLSKEECIRLDAELMNIISTIKTFVKNRVSPQSQEAKEVVLQMMDLVFRTVQDKSFFEQLQKHEDTIVSEMDDFRFPNFFTPEEEAFLEQVTKSMENES